MLTLAPLLVDPPDLLIADEPGLGLAPLVVAQVMGLFSELRDKGVTFMIVEEKAKSVLELADNVAVLDLGRITWTGSPEHLHDDNLVDAYLGVAVRGTQSTMTSWRSKP